MRYRAVFTNYFSPLFNYTVVSSLTFPTLLLLFYGFLVIKSHSFNQQNYHSVATSATWQIPNYYYYTCPPKLKAGSNLHKIYLLDVQMKNILEQHRFFFYLSWFLVPIFNNFHYRNHRTNKFRTIPLNKRELNLVPQCYCLNNNNFLINK